MGSVARLLLCIAWLGVSLCSEEIASKSSSGSGDSAGRQTRQLLYSPFLFPSGGNYQAGFSNLSPPSSFWSNLHSVPALHKSGFNGQQTLQLPSHGGEHQGDDPATVSVPIISAQTLAQQQGNRHQDHRPQIGNQLTSPLGSEVIILPYSQVEHGNLWNFDDSNLPGSSALGYYFPFLNVNDQPLSSASEPKLKSPTPIGFQRGHVEGRPVSFKGPRVTYNSGTGLGFNRANVEGRPKPDYGRGQGYNQLPQPQSLVRHPEPHVHERPASSFDRGAVEAVPDFIDEHDEGFNGLGADNRAVNGDYKVVCYFANWASYREGKGAFFPEYINATLCTHIIYAFATFDKTTNVIVSGDPAVDVDNDFYRRVLALKQVNPSLKVLLSVGGWADSGDDKYSNLAHNPISRTKFASESVKFLQKYGFDGLAIDWHYPKCWQSNCDAGPGSDSTAFGDLLRELSRQFKPRGYLLAATLSGYKEVIDEAYHVPTINQYLDLMNIMTYDYHGSWETQTGHIAPLFYLPNTAHDKFPHYNANYTMEYYVSLGADRSKLIMGIPMYGQTFELRDRSGFNVGDPVLGAGAPGEYTKQPGMLAYYEICSRVKSGWMVKKDRTASMGPIAYSDNQWVGFDDPEFVARKSRYIRGSGFGGAFVWTLDLDDFNNMCCTGSMPLLKVIAAELLNVRYKKENHCNQPSFPPAPGGTPSTPSTSTELPFWQTSTTRPPWVQTPSTTTTTTTSTTTYRPSWTTQAPNQYPDFGGSFGNRCNSSTFVPLAASNECDTYYQCIFDTIVKRRCAKGLHYNEDTQMCDWPMNARCQREEIGLIESSTVPSWQESPTKAPSGGGGGGSIMNQECRNGEYLPAEDCNQYYLCSLNRKMLQRCPAGLHWNRNQRLCDWPTSANCKENSNKIVYPAPGPDVDWQQIQQPGVVGGPQREEPCKEGAFYPSNRDCGAYYICVHGKMTEFHCQGGLYWNQGASICDWPQSAGCNLAGSGSETGSGAGFNPQPPPATSAPTSPPFGNPDMTPATTRPTMRPTRPTMRPTRPPPPPTQAPVGTYPPSMGPGSNDLGPLVAGQDTAINSDFMLVCYFTNWALYRPEGFKYYPHSINSNLCTHIIYGFAVLNPSTLQIKIHDPWADLEYGQKGFYNGVTSYKNMGIKVLIAIGGWNDSEGDKYSKLVNNPGARARFIQNILEFLRKYNFDGLDLDWEYPKCWQVDCSKGPASDKPAFAAFVKELKEAFQPYGYLLSAAVSPAKSVIDEGYDVPTLSRYLDWISVMTYDYHGQWDKKTGHVAPLYLHEEDDNIYFNSNFTINYWIRKGADRRKIVMGMPMYGQAFTLTDERYNGLNAPAKGAGTQGFATRQAGFLSYYEICDLVRNKGYTLVRDPSGAMGPFAYKGNQWVSFDDVDMIRRKSEYIRSMDIGGGMIWALDLDDFPATCGQGSYPLLTTIKNVLSAPRGSDVVLVGAPSNVSPQQTGNRPMATTTTMRPTQRTTTQASVDWSAGAVANNRPPTEGFQGNEGVENEMCSDEPFRPHKTDCSKYYQCIFDRYIEQRCPPNTYWNQNRCDWSCGHPVPTKPPSNPDSGMIAQGPTSTQPQGTTTRPGTTNRPATTTLKVTSTTTTTRRTTTTYTTSRRPPPTQPISGNQPTPRPDPPNSTSAPGNFNCPKAPPKGEYDWEPATATETNTATPIQVPKSDYMVVCYFTNWAWYRPGTGRYKPSDVDFNLCTHIAYGFAVLDSTRLLIKPHDSWADLDNKFYRQVTALKARGLKVVLAIGGWNDSAGDKYSKLVNDPAARKRFVEHVVEFLERHCFDGLDLDWEYPKCWQVDCKKGPDSDKAGFAALVRELSAAFKPRGLLLSSAVSPSKMVIDEGYDVPTLSRHFDWISVMTYDYHGQWDKKTGHVAPMFLHDESDNAFFNTNYTINYWINQGADPKKLVMGMPMYGQSFTLVNPKENGLNAKSSGGGTAGEFTRQAGFLAYYEICRHILTGEWVVIQDDSGAIGPYAYKGNQWVSFDDISMIKRKAQYIKDMRLGGGMIWALDLDDFRGNCGCGRHPLLKTINRVLRNYRDVESASSCRLS